MTTMVPKEEAVVSIPIAIVLTISTCGIYNLFWLYKQMHVLNGFLQAEEYIFWKWFFLALITCGIYHFYFEYKKAESIKYLQQKAGVHVSTDLGIISILVSFFGLCFVADAIHQDEINKFYEKNITLTN